jgi:hypothetical protein
MTCGVCREIFCIRPTEHQRFPAWTLGSAIQPHIDLYVSQTTFNEVKRAFPYLGWWLVLTIVCCVFIHHQCPRSSHLAEAMYAR